MPIALAHLRRRRRPAVEVDAVVAGPCPSTRAAGIRSFMRLMQRRIVDLPQPDGPMMAVTSLAANVESRRPCTASACRSRRRRSRIDTRGRRRRPRASRRRGSAVARDRRARRVGARRRRRLGGAGSGRAPAGARAALSTCARSRSCHRLAPSLDEAGDEGQDEDHRRRAVSAAPHARWTSASWAGRRR